MTASQMTPADTSETTLGWNLGGGINLGTPGVARHGGPSLRRPVTRGLTVLPVPGEPG